MRKELIVFIQPTVVADDYGVRSASYTEDIRTSVGAEAANRFPQTVTIPAPPVPDSDVLEKKNFFQRMFIRDKKPQ